MEGLYMSPYCFEIDPTTMTAETPDTDVSWDTSLLQQNVHLLGGFSPRVQEDDLTSCYSTSEGQSPNVEEDLTSFEVVEDHLLKSSTALQQREFT
jgi:hypothetical protein